MESYESNSCLKCIMNGVATSPVRIFIFFLEFGFRISLNKTLQNHTK